MIQFPNAKVNLGLNIIRKRTDGYHDLETVFYPVLLHDILEVVAPTKCDSFKFTKTGISLPAGINLCEKAFLLLRKKFPAQVHDVQMHLHKMIPTGAGLGGGSSDASFVLRMLNELLELKLSQSILIELASELGSDCPFFIENRPIFAQGRGEVMESIEVNLKGKYFLFVFPEIHVSTATAFSNIHPKIPTKHVSEIVRQDISTWRAELVNDFELSIFSSHPKLRQIKEMLYNAGARYASMSGSGSVMFGIFDEDVSELRLFRDMQSKCVACDLS